MTDEELLTVIACVCDFDRAGVEKWRTEALLIARAIEQAARTAPAARNAGLTDEQNHAISHAQKVLRAVKLYQHADLLAAPEALPEIPEGCTPEDAQMLRLANHGLAQEIDRYRVALSDLCTQIHTFAEQNGEADFETGRAEKLLQSADGKSVSFLTDHERIELYELRSVVEALPEAAPVAIYECNNEDCGWKGEWSATVHPKHDSETLLCPKCYETTEKSSAPVAKAVPETIERCPNRAYVTMGFDTVDECTTFIKSISEPEAAPAPEPIARDVLTELRVARVELGIAISDPMWADHAEVHKLALKRWHTAINAILESVPKENT